MKKPVFRTEDRAKAESGEGPREFTEDEMRERFLGQLRTYVHYWATVKDPYCKVGETDIHARLSGLAFSFLNILDGTTDGLPSLEVVPHPHESDKQFHIDEGENYWPPFTLPEGTKTIHGNVDGEVMLHDCWHERD